MASLDDSIKKFDSLVNTLEREIPRIIISQNVTAKSLVQNRIQETGKNKQGSQLGNYSNRPIPAFFFIGKGKKTTDAKLKKLAREKKNISYAEFRRLDGKQNEHVDLTFTGKMWRGIGLTTSNTSGKKTSVKIGPKDGRTDKVAGYNRDRYGDFLDLSEDEIKQIEEDVQFEIEQILNTELNGL